MITVRAIFVLGSCHHIRTVPIPGKTEEPSRVLPVSAVFCQSSLYFSIRDLNNSFVLGGV